MGGIAGLQILPRSYLVLGRSVSVNTMGFMPNYIYGEAISLLDPLEAGAVFAQTVALYDAEGALVDAVAYDQNWPLVPDHSMELKHPWMDNDLVESWAAAGGLHTYGAADHIGNPKDANLTSYEGLPHPDCYVPTGSSVCAVAGCGLDSHCALVPAEGCCEADGDCEDGEVCTADLCDAASLARARAGDRASAGPRTPADATRWAGEVLRAGEAGLGFLQRRSGATVEIMGIGRSLLLRSRALPTR